MSAEFPHSCVEFFPLADLGVSGGAVASAWVGREGSGVKWQSQQPLGCSQTVPVPGSGGQSWSQARALQCSKLTVTAVISSPGLLHFLEGEMVLELLPLRAELPV